jgi:hypothetical protein
MTFLIALEEGMIGILPWLNNIGGLAAILTVLIVASFGTVLYLVLKSAYFSEESQQLY